MRFISIKRARPGDILGQSILSNDGNMMLREGIILTDRYIHKLKVIGVDYIYINDDKLNDVETQDPKFIQIKSDVVKLLSKSFIKLEHNSTELEMNETLQKITDIVEYLLDHKEINSAHLSEIKTYDNYTYVHSLNTCVISLFFGVQMNLAKSKLLDLGMGCLLHDIGKTKIPKTILNKPDRLTYEEFEIMKRHSKLGYDILEKFNYISERSKLIVLEHHERLDGTGYPSGIKGNKISLFGKIAAISDVYDAIVSDRAYRKGVSGSEAYELILGGAGTLFEWELVNIFKNNFSIYPPGSCVKLSNGQEAFVVRDNKGFPDRPVVRILYDEKGNELEPYELDLIEQIDICIDNMVI